MADITEDELEYHVSFPTKIDKIFNYSEFPDSHEDTKEPVIFLLGWAGCKDKYLSKYSLLYEERGCITIRYTTPMKYIFVYNEHIHVLATKLLDLLNDMHLNEHPILFHCFSNGGAITYHYICEVMKKSAYSFNIIGCVFDSCPSRRSLRSICTACWELFPGNFFTKIFLEILLVFYVLFQACCWLLLCLIKSRSFVLPPWTLVDEENSWPQLFLYSKNDHIICHKDIEEFIRKRKERNVPVESVCWDDSVHVQHLRFHKEAYINVVSNFLKQCLKSKNCNKSM